MPQHRCPRPRVESLLLLITLSISGCGSYFASVTPTTQRRTSPVRANAADEDTRFEGQIAQFAPKRMLPMVRVQRRDIQEQLDNAVANEDYVLAAQLRDDLAELRQKDPAVMAMAMREQLERDVEREDYKAAALCRDRLLVLRRFLPQYQLAGLWKGNYPNHGDELVRLQYQGDTLIATKVTGDEHVPAGEVTFRAELTQPSDGGDEDDWLPLASARATSARWACVSRCSRSHRMAGMSRARSNSIKARGGSRRAASATRTTCLASCF